MRAPSTRAAAALAVVLAGCSTAAAATAAGTTGTQSFTASFLTIGRSDKPTHVVATGPISGIGSATQTEKSTASGQVNYVTLQFDKGTVRMVAVEPSFGWKMNARACTASAYGHGTFRITGGTGNYRGATGKGTFTTTGTAVAQRSTTGACRGGKTPQSEMVFYVEIALKGVAALPAA